MTHALQHLASLMSTHSDNGILTSVPSQYVGRAHLSLPDAASVPDSEISIEVDAGWLGLVRLTFRKYRYTRPMAQVAAVAWSCRLAERVPSSPQAS